MERTRADVIAIAGVSAPAHSAARPYAHGGARPGLKHNRLQTNPFFLAIGLPILWLTRNSAARTRFGSSVGCALIVTLYTMNYELALLVPALVGPGALSMVLDLGFLAETLVVLIPLLALTLETGAQRGHRGDRGCAG